MLDELVREGYLSASDLDFTNLRATQHSRYGVHYNSEHFTTQTLDLSVSCKVTCPLCCRLERRLSSRMSQESERDAERRELRIWMRRKQREQLAVYQKHRESLRERERRPFSGTLVRCVYLFTVINTEPSAIFFPFL